MHFSMVFRELSPNLRGFLANSTLNPIKYRIIAQYIVWKHVFSTKYLLIFGVNIMWRIFPVFEQVHSIKLIEQRFTKKNVNHFMVYSLT